MPSVDLRPLFTPPDDDPRRSSNPLVAAENRTPVVQPSVFSKFRFTGPQLVNLGFVIVACLGAVFSAAYLFKGDELFHEVAAWPRELFSGRPAAIAQRQDDSNISDVIAAIPDPAVLAANSINNSGDPFSSSRKLLGLESLPGSNILRPNEGLSISSPASTFPANNPVAPIADPALGLNPISGGTAAPPANSSIANGASTAAQSVSNSAAQTATGATSSASTRAVKAANRVSSLARNSGGQAARVATARAARVSPLRRAMAAIARTFGSAKADKAKGAIRAQTNGRLAQMNRSRAINHRAIAQRQSKIANHASHAARTATAKRSINSAGARNLPPASRIAARSALTSRSNGTIGGTGFSRGGASSMRSFGSSNFSGSDGGFRSLGSMGGGRGFGGGGGGGMGLGGGHGLGRGR